LRYRGKKLDRAPFVGMPRDPGSGPAEAPDQTEALLEGVDRLGEIAL
jgi:hypothetical protein